MGGYGYMMNSWTGAIIVGIVGLVILGVLVYLLFKVGSGSFGASSSPPHETPLDILKERYARGEISKDQFDEMKKDL